MQLSSNDIFSMLNYLNIKHKTNPNYKGWIDIICPNHNDKDFGNAGVNINSGAIKCFRCGYKSHVLKEIKKFCNIQDYKEFLKFLQLNFYINLPNTSYTQSFKNNTKISNKSNTKNFDIINKEYTKYITKDININESKYLKDRSFTSKFCFEFHIKHIITGFYKDYFAIPIINSNKNLVTIEFRKLLQYEYYQKFYNKEIITEEDIKNFKEYCKKENFYLDKSDVLKKGNKEYHNSVIQYLLKPKVKYELGSRIDETIWNIDNLDFNEDLYVCEGIGSLCKLYNNVSENVTCTFGSNVSEYQLELLKKFKKNIILIPDEDEAGEKMILRLFSELKNFYLILTSFEDVDKEYIEDIKNTAKILASDYVSKTMIEKLF